jgi:hypothetical protein
MALWGHLGAARVDLEAKMDPKREPTVTQKLSKTSSKMDFKEVPKKTT